MAELDKTLLPSEKILYRTSVAPIFKVRIWLLFFALLGLAVGRSTYPGSSHGLTWPARPP